MTKKTLLISNGGPLSSREIRHAKNSAIDLIIAADGGANRAIKAEIQPDIVIGDFDSVSDQTASQLKHARWIHRPSQQTCDLEKSLIFCQEEGIRHLTVIGFTGGRLDHTLNNLSVLARYAHCFQLNLITELADVFIVQKHITLPGVPGQTISLIPMGSVEGVETQGLKYALHGESLIFGVRESISNEVIEKLFSISILSGTLIVFRLEPDT